MADMKLSHRQYIKKNESPHEKNRLPHRKRFAISPEFQKQYSAIPAPKSRNVKSPDNMRPLSPLSSENLNISKLSE